MWDATSLIVDDSTKKRVLIEAAYNKNSADFYEVASIAQQSVSYMSNQFPGLPFPFPNLTVFNGLDEMEYPMMVNDKTVYNHSYLIRLTSHEISHSYFPFYMGINETKYGWMDEGWACYIEYQICSYLDSKENANIFYMSRYKELQGNELDLPIISPSIYLKRPVYHLNTYAKSATFLFILHSQLGDDLFKKVLHEFVRRWNGKHPTPYDFFFTINDVTKQDLSWLIKPWFFEFGFVDLAINSVIKTNQGYDIIIKKIGNYPAPVNVEITYDDNGVEWVRQSVSVWSEDKSTIKINIPATKKIHSVELSDPIIPDADMTNNYYEVN
jgi:aminopeptidase N